MCSRLSGSITRESQLRKMVSPDGYPVIEQAIETAAVMLGTDTSRGYRLRTICAEFPRRDASLAEIDRQGSFGILCLVWARLGKPGRVGKLLSADGNHDLLASQTTRRKQVAPSRLPRNTRPATMPRLRRTRVLIFLYFERPQGRNDTQNSEQSVTPRCLRSYRIGRGRGNVLADE